MFPQLVQSRMWASAEPELLTVRVYLDFSEFTLNSLKGLPRSREKSFGAQGIPTPKLNASVAASPASRSVTNAILMANNYFFFKIGTYNLPFFVEKWMKKKYIYMYKNIYSML